MQPEDKQQDYQAENQPPAQPEHAAPQPVYLSRPVNPGKPVITEEVRARHEESVKKYPNLNLSGGEYVIMSVRRHPIGIVSILAFVSLLLIILLAFIPLYASFLKSANASGLPEVWAVSVIVLLLASLVAIGGYIAFYIYINNRFYLTNESVIQEIQTSLFSKHEQTVSLGSIEDASFYQQGILPHIFNYGRIRLSTMGDETTYRFSFVANPKNVIATLNNAVEAFKSGHPTHH